MRITSTSKDLGSYLLSYYKKHYPVVGDIYSNDIEARLEHAHPKLKRLYRLLDNTDQWHETAILEETVAASARHWHRPGRHLPIDNNKHEQYRVMDVTEAVLVEKHEKIILGCSIYRVERHRSGFDYVKKINVNRQGVSYVWAESQWPGCVALLQQSIILGVDGVACAPLFPNLEDTRPTASASAELPEELSLVA